jgi:predicted RNA-binding Zn-ribbon protein involved in translation (DUF1610 family)|tara:strand:+ start:2319 stop:2525 length:207 start_codon:yes stop_codon:yes gene_type:complete
MVMSEQEWLHGKLKERENMKCPKCNAKMIWGGDHDNDDDENQYIIMSNFLCPDCETMVYVNWSEKEAH